MRAKSDTKEAAAGHSRCGRAACENREGKKDQFLVCSGCEVMDYCSPNCQTLDWKSTHRKQCAKIKSEREASGASTSNREIKKKYVRLQDSGADIEAPGVGISVSMVGWPAGAFCPPTPTVNTGKAGDKAGRNVTSARLSVVQTEHDASRAPQRPVSPKPQVTLSNPVVSHPSFVQPPVPFACPRCFFLYVV